MTHRGLLLLSLAALALARPAWGDGPPADSRPAELRDVGFDQQLGAQVPLDLTFRNEAGEPVTLGSLLRGKPVILSLAYYQCPMLCTLVLNGLTSAMRALPFDAGSQYDVITVSIDPRETAAMATAKKATYLESYKRPGAADGWHFLTGDADSIARLAAAVGFRYKFLPERNEFAHAAGIMVLTPTGTVARYFYGVEFSPRDLRLGLIEAAENRIGTPVDQLLLFCYRYDPSTGRYTTAVLTFIRLGGVATVLALAAFLLRSLRRERASAAAAVARAAR